MSGKKAYPGFYRKMKGTDTMNSQDKAERQIRNILSYWAGRKKEAGFHFIAQLPQNSKGTFEQDDVLISGRKFSIIYTQASQAIWSEVIVQEQYSGKVYSIEVEDQTPDTH